MEQLRIELDNPALRDGTPADVARGTLDDLDDLARQLEPFFLAAERQVRNAVLDLLTEGSTPSEAAAVYRDWEKSRAGGAVCALGGQATYLQQLGEILRRAVDG